MEEEYNSDLSYALRRLNASRMNDSEIFDIIMRLKDLLRGINMGELNPKNILSEMEYIKDLPDNESIVNSIVIQKINNAICPFIDEWDSRHKN